MAETIHGPTRWGRKAVWALGILLLVLLSAHAMWTSIAASRFNQRLAALKRAGEPVELDDLAIGVEHAPLDSNVLAAAALIDPAAAEWNDRTALRQIQLPLDEADRSRFEATIAANRAVLERLDTSNGERDLERVLSPTTSARPSPAPRSNLRQLCTLLMMQAIVEHQRGNDRIAVTRLVQVMRVGRSMQRAGGLIDHLLGRAIDDDAASLIPLIAQDVSIGTGPNDAATSVVRELIDALLEDGPTAEGLVQSFQTERLRGIYATRSMMSISGSTPPMNAMNPVKQYLMRPFYVSAGGKMIDHYEGLLAAAAQPTWPAARQKLPRPIRSASPLAILEPSINPSFGSLVQAKFRALTRRHLSATAVAIRWYAVEHAGRLPARLEDLVPAYLPSVPKDLYTPDLRPLRYKPDDDPPVVYSVSEDGVDDGGKDLVDYLQMLTAPASSRASDELEGGSK